MCFNIALAILPVMAIILGITTEKFNSNASFYSILISIVALLVLYPFLKANTFLITTPLSVILTLILFWGQKKRVI